MLRALKGAAYIAEHRQAAELALNIMEVVQVNIVLTWAA